MCVSCLVWLGLYGIYGCATSASIFNGFISSSHSLPPFTTPPRCYPARPPYRHPHQYAPSAQHRGANKRPIEGARDANDATTPSPAHRVTSPSLFLGRFLFWGILFLAGEEEKSNEAGNRIEISFFFLLFL